jgi:Flp pilus assembly protein protease CpaA
LRIYNRYLLLMVFTTCLVNVVLAFMGQKNITVYFIANFLITLLLTVLFISFSPRTRRVLSSISFVLFAGFVVVAVLKVLEVIKQ